MTRLLSKVSAIVGNLSRSAASLCSRESALTGPSFPQVPIKKLNFVRRAGGVIAALSMLTLSMLVAQTANAAITNGSFESPGSACSYSPTNVPGWTFNYGGLVGYSTCWGGAAESGTYYAMLQSAGDIQQQVAFNPGDMITFWGTQRPYNVAYGNPVSVYVNGVLIGTVTPPANASGWQSYTLPSHVATAGTYTLLFQGVGVSGQDTTAYLDNISQASGTFGTAVVSYSAYGTATVGTTLNVNYTVTLTAYGGQIILGSTLDTPVGSLSEYTYSTPSTNPCVAGQYLAAGASCNLVTINTFTPSATGLQFIGFTVTPQYGTASIGNANAGSGNGVAAGTATVSTSGVSCTGFLSNASSCTGTATITASGGQVILNATPVAMSGAKSADFSVAAGVCGSANLASGASCNLGTVTFTPSSTSSETATVTAGPSIGTAAAGATLTGTNVPQCTFSLSNSTCAATSYGSGEGCPTMVLTAGGASNCESSVNTAFNTSSLGYFAEASVSGSGCSTATYGQTCLFNPYYNAAGNSTTTVTINTSGNSPQATLSGSVLYGTTSTASTESCPAVGVGAGSSTCATVTITASTYPVTFGAAPASSSNSQFSYTGGTCANSTVAAAGTCTLLFSFTPTTGGAQNSTLTVSPSGGTGVSLTLTGTGVYGTLVASPTSLTCANLGVGLSETCSTGSITLTASGGPLTLSATPFSSTDSTDFTVALGTCTANKALVSGGSCTTGSITFNPTTAGAKSDTVTVATATGTGTTFGLSGTGLNGSLAATGTITCAATNAGSSTTCTGSITLTASGGPVTLTATPFTNSDGADFTVGLGTCTASSTITSGSSCSTGTISFNPTTAGAKSDTVTVNASAGTGTTFSVTGTSTAYLTVSPTSLSCSATQGVNTAGTCGTVTLTANGGSITLGSTPFASSDAEFVEALGTCTANLVLTSGTTCTTGQLSFTPTSSGVKSTTITVASSVANATYSASGTGVYGSLAASGTVTCPTVNAGSSSTCTGTITITASGGPVVLTSTPFSPSDTTDFTVGLGTCTAGATIASGSSCSPGTITFNPTTSGTKGDIVTVNAASGFGNSIAFSLSGTSTAYLTVSPTSLSCSATQGINTTGTCGTVTLTANGGSITLGSTPFASSDAEFTQTLGTCTANAVLTSGGMCTTGQLSFKPTSTGAKSTTVTAASSAANVTYSASGTGVNGTLSASPTSYAFGNVGVGLAGQDTAGITLTATGGPVTLSSSPFSNSDASDFAVSAGTCTANLALAENATCTTSWVSFVPSSAGAKSDTVTVNTSVGTGTTVSLTGTGVNGALAATGTITCPAVNAGSSSTCTGSITLTASGGPVTLTATPFSNSDSTDFTVGLGTCTASSTIASGSSCSTGTITFTPATAGTKADTVTVNASAGSGTTFGITATASAYLTVSPASLSCPTQGINTTGTCGTVTITANGGSVTLGAAPFSSSDAEFVQAFGTCTANLVLTSGSTCTTGQLSFTPTTTGAKSTAVTIASSAANIAYTASGTGVSGSLTSSGTISCASTNVGSSKTCTGTLTLTASGGPVVLTSSPFTSSDSTDFTVALGTCTAGSTIASGSSCSPGTITFNPATTGAKADAVAVTAASGTGTSFMLSGTPYGTIAASPTSLSCGSTGAGASLTCGAGTTTITASGGAISFGATPFANTDSTDFTVPAGTCANANLTSGQTCTTGTILFNPTTVGSKTDTVTATPTDGSTTTFALSGTAVADTISIGSTSGTVCAATGEGTTSSNCGYIYVSSIGPVALSNPYVTSSNPDFTVGSATCTNGGTVNGANSCYFYYNFTPSVIGADSATFTVHSANNSVAQVVSGTGVTGSLTASGSVSCPSTNAGSSSACTGTITLTASSGPVTLASSPFTSSDSTDFTIGGGGTCTDSLALASGASCTVGTITFNPATYNTKNDTVTVNVATGAGTTFTLTGTGLSYLTVSPTSVNCGNAGVGGQYGCAELTLTANGGPVDLSSTPFSNSDSEFTLPVGTCTASDNLSAGSTCTTNAVQFLPTSTGAKTDTLTVSASFGTGTTVSVTGTGTDGTLAATGSVTCPAVNAGGSAACIGSITLTASNGPVTLTSSPFSSSDPGDFTVALGTCTANLAIASGSSCTTGTITFNPASTGTKSDAVTVNVTSGTGTSFSLSGTTNGILTASGNSSCPNSSEEVQVTCSSVTVTAEGGPVSFDGAAGATSSDSADFSVGGSCANTTLLAGQSCTVSVTFHPTTTGSLSANIGVAPTSGSGTTFTASGTGTITYGWVAGGFGSCTGGSGTWSYGSWAPTTGCGAVTQTESATCNVTLNSGTATQTVTCQDGNGNVVANSNCTGTEPPTSESCTPSTGYSCGTEAPTAQTVTLTNGCNYTWNTGSFSACTGGASTWTYTSWTPAVGSACTTAFNQTRTGTCTATPNSGSETRTVTCQDQNGDVVDNSNCTGTVPVVTETCTPTAGACGTEGALSQTVSDLSTCSYSWHASGFGACTGGTGAWAYLSWTPTCGVGPTTQTRTGTCAGTTNSGQQSQTVTCVRTDGTVVANSFCTGTAPATSAACTPTAGFSCGMEGTLTQKVTLTNKCTTQTACVVSPANTCATIG